MDERCPLRARLDDSSQHRCRHDQPGDHPGRVLARREIRNDAVLGMVLPLDPSGWEAQTEFVEPLERFGPGAVGQADLCRARLAA